MLKNEAKWIGEVLKEIPDRNLGRVLDVGGSSNFFRKFRQPFINKYIFLPLKKQGIEIIHTDRELDITHKNFSKKVKKLGTFNAVFAFNLLEHVKDYKSASKNLAKVVPKGGYVFVSVPKVFPYHPDPIDNMFRPTLLEIKTLFPGFKAVKEAVVSQKYLFMVNRKTILWFNKEFSATCLLLKKCA